MDRQAKIDAVNTAARKLLEAHNAYMEAWKGDRYLTTPAPDPAPAQAADGAAEPSGQPAAAADVSGGPGLPWTDPAFQAAYRAWKAKLQPGEHIDMHDFAAGWNAALTRPATVTAEMVEAACAAYFVERNGFHASAWARVSEQTRRDLAPAMRSALTAALSARQEGA